MDSVLSRVDGVAMEERSITLKEFILEKLNTYIDSHKAVHLVEQKAVDDKAASMLIRLDEMNQFRAQLDRQATTFVTGDILRSEIKIVNADIRRIEDNIGIRVRPLEEFQKEFMGRLLLIGGVITALNVGIAIVSHFVK